MAVWKAIKIFEAINNIVDNTYVLPVIQRRLVWDEEKMELIFDTLLKGDSFGGIIVLKEEKGTEPLFAFRPFTKDGSEIDSINVNKLDQNIFLVIDGQQRLQSFYIGMLGSFNGKKLYFNLLNDYNMQVFEFKFANDSTKLPKKSKDNEGVEQDNLWYQVNSLFNRLKETRDDRQVADEIIKSNQVDKDKESYIYKNVGIFYDRIFKDDVLGISNVDVNKSYDISFNRQKIVESFKRLNDGGTRLQSFDLVASRLKGLNWTMEEFLDEVTKNYRNIGVGQDFIIKLIFLLQDDHKKVMLDFKEEDADFAINNQERIKATLDSLLKYLKLSELYDYYNGGRRSAIPLYFVSYHIFHKSVESSNILNIFDNFDTSNEDFKNMSYWLYISLLFGVFRSRGPGWDANTTGISKILDTIKKYRDKNFPVYELFAVYQNHPLHMFSESTTKHTIENCDKNFLFYLVYNRRETIGNQDIDHIHPKSLLRDNNIEWEKINSIANYQLIDSGTNRNIKRAKPLKDWILSDINNKKAYLERHLIPHNPDNLNDTSLWEISCFDQFLNERRTLIVSKVQSVINQYKIDEPNQNGAAGVADSLAPPQTLLLGILESEMIIRNETMSDIATISEITEIAFKTLAISHHTEQFIIKALRADNALTISLVAEIDGQVVGHIAFSPVTISDGTLNWHGLGPISVLPEYQKQGIGKALIHKGLSLLKDLGSQGCALVGDPNYYNRFGFKNIPDLIYEGIPQEYFLALPFNEKNPRGIIVFHKGFSATG